MDREILWLGRDNTIDVQLKADGAAQDLSGATHMALVFSGSTISSVGRSTWFDWTSGSTGVIKFKLGGATISAGIYDAELIVYDTTNENGIHWGTIPIIVKN